MPLTYPVGPTTRAVMCSLRFLLFTISVCEPEVVPASPLTTRVAPFWWATESKCTPWLPTAFRAALY